MSRRIFNGAPGALLVVALVALGGALACSHKATADDQGEGRVVNISPNGNGGANAATIDEASAPADEHGAPKRELPAYWLGIQGQPIDSPVLRTHLQLADDVGVVIANVIKDSPAEKAGLRRHDILLAVNGEEITDMATLQRAVAASEGKPVELKIIRLAKEDTVKVTPEVPPKDLVVPAPEGGNAMPGFPGMGNMQMGDLQGMFDQLQRNGGVRVFGPGMVFNGMQAGALPNGVSLSVTRQGNGPATVTVNKGGQTWTVKGDDADAIKKLPEDVRPLVEQALNGQALGGMPNFPGLGDMPGLRHRVLQGDGNDFQPLEQRVQELERQLQQLQQQFPHEGEGTK
jgi:membrane-associated protease RseP (regulator of RpoE activity)